MRRLILAVIYGPTDKSSRSLFLICYMLYKYVLGHLYLFSTLIEDGGQGMRRENGVKQRCGLWSTP